VSASLLDSRRAGVLLHISSLPSPYGAGDLGHAAHRFVEFLAAAGFSVWQTLPLGPTHADLSPYNATSVHAGNPRLISLDWLHDRDLLQGQELERLRAGDLGRSETLAHAARRFAGQRAADAGLQADFGAFCQQHGHWLEDYALFTAIREARLGAGWVHWPQPLRDRDARALGQARLELHERIDALRFEQYVFARQWSALRDYAAAHGVTMFGDMPIFVAHDSADVWASPRQFRLDAEGMPQCVTGVPPDYFSAEGQRWGNPHYHWEAMARDGFSWWRRRIASERQRFDLLRIDHFRGFEACWEIPHDSATAIGGHWAPAPGAALLAALQAESGSGTLVAENLGVITPEVECLRREFGLPGMLILQFAFDGDAVNPYLPHNHEPLNVVYTGTHDNDTTLGWFEQLDEATRHHVTAYLGQPGEPMPWPLLRAAFASVARLAVVPMQDILALDGRHRMNRPGLADGNWRWQFDATQIDPGLAQRLRLMIESYGRLVP
jgi:4-alpha-glucanotransferase